MDELIEIMKEILSEIEGISYKLDSIKGNGLYDSISDVCDKLESIKGDGLYNSVSDVCNKLDSIDTSIDLLK